MCNEKTQIKFEFGSNRILFGLVMSLGLRKLPIVFSFRSISPSQIDISNSKFGIQMSRENTQVKFELGSDRKLFSAELWPLYLIFNNFQYQT